MSLITWPFFHLTTAPLSKNCVHGSEEDVVHEISSSDDDVELSLAPVLQYVPVPTILLDSKPHFLYRRLKKGKTAGSKHSFEDDIEASLGPALQYVPLSIISHHESLISCVVG